MPSGRLPPPPLERPDGSSIEEMFALINARRPMLLSGDGELLWLCRVCRIAGECRESQPDCHKALMGIAQVYAEAKAHCHSDCLIVELIYIIIIFFLAPASTRLAG